MYDRYFHFQIESLVLLLSTRVKSLLNSSRLTSNLAATLCCACCVGTEEIVMSATRSSRVRVLGVACTRPLCRVRISITKRRLAASSSPPSTFTLQGPYLRTGVLERGTMLRRMLHVQMLLLASALKPPLEPLVRTHYSARSVVRSIRALDVPSTCHSPPHQRLLGHVQGYGP